MPITRALLSVSDKTGITELARALLEAGAEIVSSGGTAQVLQAAGVPVTSVEQVTGAPEMLGGRVKTLHPLIYGGILADRAEPSHLREIDHLGISPIDLVVVDLYPFERALAEGLSEDELIEHIDIGGVALIRAAAKNWRAVTVAVAPERYPDLLEAMRNGGPSLELRYALALEAFSHTAAYDAAIARYLAGEEWWGERLVISAPKLLDLRYGENPHQRAALYEGPGRGIGSSRQLNGKELSYNNLLDANAAWRLAASLEPPAAVIVKHTNPCGAACAGSLEPALRAARACDESSAFGGIVALNATCDGMAAHAVVETFFEVVVAPGYDTEALDILRRKKNLRVLSAEAPTAAVELRSISGGLLVQSCDEVSGAAEWTVVTKAEPLPEQLDDLRFAWEVAAAVKSNAIVLAAGRATVGIGAGQMSRVQAAEIATRNAGARAIGAVCASDAFFPFADGIEKLVEAGVSAVVQPGGSLRDHDVIAAADKRGLAMVFTGQRHFRH
ncbi:MAG: bifunctional phosphoribosylaminoimidazolecarboxamide formyltransferase/IMP cyclohydrolase [Actinobacteria bacterium]|nr:bifunctional phosphoribosylaminoimidazolecarboxamide formyltransferase/IMP cyclohydrolase [Actinomycetota bacterium]